MALRALRVVGVVRVTGMATFSSKMAISFKISRVCHSLRHILDRYILPERQTFSSWQLLRDVVDSFYNQQLQVACYYPSPLRESSTSSLYLSLFDVSLS